jgi:hypothetical protein
MFHFRAALYHLKIQGILVQNMLDLFTAKQVLHDLSSLTDYQFADQGTLLFLFPANIDKSLFAYQLLAYH